MAPETVKGETGSQPSLHCLALKISTHAPLPDTTCHSQIAKPHAEIGIVETTSPSKSFQTELLSFDGFHKVVGEKLFQVRRSEGDGLQFGSAGDTLLGRPVDIVFILLKVT